MKAIPALLELWEKLPSEFQALAIISAVLVGVLFWTFTGNEQRTGKTK